jgi:uncharacterized membrane protein
VNEVTTFQFIALVLRIALGSLFAILGLIFAVPQLYRGYVRGLQSWLRHVTRQARKPMPVEALVRLHAAEEQRRSVTIEPPQAALTAIGVVMIGSGIVGALGLVDIGTLISAVFAAFCVVICWWSMRARPTQGERRVASLQPHAFPGWFKPWVLAIPLLQIPVIAVISREGRTLDGAIVILSILVGTATAYIYAKYADRALFGGDQRAESIVDDNMRGSTALVLSFAGLTGPCVYLFERYMAFAPLHTIMSHAVLWFDLIPLYAFLAFSGRMLKKRRQAILNLGLDKPPGDVVA